MASRALAFSDSEIVRMGREDYVAVAADDWYQRERDDDEGRFFRSVADQGPKKGESGANRQGIYSLTASGKLLAYENAGHKPELMREVLRQGLKEWRALPESERAPGAFKVPEHGQPDPAYVSTPPSGGLILSVYTRALDRDGDGLFSDAVCQLGGGDEAARDHLWLTATEWRSLIPDNAREGDEFAVPAGIAERILRFHLVDNTRGVPPLWRKREIRSSHLNLVVEQANGSSVELRLEGAALLATDADVAKADRGYDLRLLGYLKYDKARESMERFDVVAVGDFWGSGPYTRHPRPGRTPLGVAFELSPGTSLADRVPPFGVHRDSTYFGDAR